HGALDRAALEVRLPAAPLVTAFALVATLASLVWALRDGPALLFASWSVLLGAVGIVYVVVPGVWRGPGPQTAALAAEQTPPARPRPQPAPGWPDIHRGAWARAGPPLVAVEADSGLRFAPVATHDSTTWFGPGFREFAVAAPDSWPSLQTSGIPLAGSWRRTAL